MDISRLKPLFLAPGQDVKAVAAAGLGEALVDSILAHRGNGRKRESLEFQVDVTWETWEKVKKLSAVDNYIKTQPGSGLKALMKK